ncbi:FG-GAP-like repeat-containing protein [Streptomyces sp. NPDC059247]|uniref:FG-GAP-like repeat-containing protein n=1 Tax=Streptomyces sp. NPDC059247 TaxID=3346790 RepID=UPI003682E673
MSSAFTNRRRFGACVATVLAVTVGAGALTVPEAVAAPATTEAFGAAVVPGAADAAVLPAGAEIVSVGDTGYLTSRRDVTRGSVLEWHRSADGSVVPVGAGLVGVSSVSDTVVVRDGDKVALWDMTAATPTPVTVDIAAEFRPGASVVGAVGSYLYVKVPTTGDYHQLWQLSPNTDGTTTKSEVVGGDYGLDFKVAFSTGYDLLLFGSQRQFSGPTYSTNHWMSRTNVKGATWTERWDTGLWTPSSTGTFTADYTASVQQWSGATVLVVDGPYAHRRYTMDASQAGTVIAGISGHTLLYGVPGKADDQLLTPLYARNIKTDAAAYPLLEDFSSVAHAPDGSILVRGSSAGHEGLFRITDSGSARPELTLVADTGRIPAVKITGSKAPTAVDLEKPGTSLPMEWTLSHTRATVELTLAHTASGRTLTRTLDAPASGATFRFAWDGLLDGSSAPNGAYTWQVAAKTPEAAIPATAMGGFTVTRAANPHDYNDNGSTDLLARDSSGVLWRQDLHDWPSATGQVTPAKRTRVGAGWQTYQQIEAVGDFAGTAPGDVLGRDAAGALWLYTGKGDGTFTTRAKVGTGWQIYDKLTGGSDLTGDNRSDLVAVDTTGTAWLYRGTGSASAPYAARVKIGAGWKDYDQITALGNIAGTSAGDLVARDKAGVLWLHQGNGKGGFATRVKIGAGWNAFTQLVGAGDVTGDGRPDLIAYGKTGTSVYRSTGTTTAPFTRQTTPLFTGEGTTFNSLA